MIVYSFTHPLRRSAGRLKKKIINYYVSFCSRPEEEDNQLLYIYVYSRPEEEDNQLLCISVYSRPEEEEDNQLLCISAYSTHIQKSI